MKKIVIVLTLGSIAACTTNEERLAEWQQQCGAFGYQPGTLEFADCMKEQDAQYDASVAAASAAILASDTNYYTNYYGY